MINTELFDFKVVIPCVARFPHNPNPWSLKWLFVLKRDVYKNPLVFEWALLYFVQNDPTQNPGIEVDVIKMILYPEHIIQLSKPENENALLLNFEGKPQKFIFSKNLEGRIYEINSA